MPWPFFIPIGVGAAILIVLVVAIVRSAGYVDPRPGELAALAQRWGFEYSPFKHDKAPEWGKPFGVFDLGEPDETAGLISGRFQGLGVEIFDYTYYEEEKDKNGNVERDYTTTTLVALVLPLAFPRFELAPDSGLREFLEFLGGRDIDFESNEFNKRFYVQSEDRKFAYAVIHPRMMEFLLETREAFHGISMQIVGERAVLRQHGRLDAAEINRVLEFAFAFYERIPDYVKKDYVAPPAKGIIEGG
ncbi:MAG: DUF3137 domain-containing protein [Verrucomicrobia bacterium]|nr:DUF3137 domain-containing protein [Verrucomicrobiota bacterium]